MRETFKIINFSWLLFARFNDGLKTFNTELKYIKYYFCKLSFCRLMHFKCENQNIIFYTRKGYCTITKKLLSFLARSLLYNNLLLEAIFIISMVMVVEGVVGVLCYGILCTFMGDGIEKSHHPRL